MYHITSACFIFLYKKRCYLNGMYVNVIHILVQRITMMNEEIRDKKTNNEQCC